MSVLAKSLAKAGLLDLRVDCDSKLGQVGWFTEQKQGEDGSLQLFPP